ncbi:MAG: isoleucine--tRNA ligase [Proteobacteria bacterium]|nr:MAG: isoleucine--tRNA ligase [Pseudomonadota bacterium]|tara:strand:+ start:2311 stop:5439 length:3129 start_codon:yes stop_codon:yes gene_type:complete
MKSVSNKINFPELESRILEFWRQENIFRKSVEERPADNEFIFYDGPPFATGLPHYGHLLAGTIKDVIPRYKTMQGYRVERRFGWDCHGLPVEYEIEQTLGLKGRPDIEEFGVGNFNEECRKIVLRYASEWRETVERMARWIDFDNDYKTMDLTFMESVWWIFDQLWKKGLIYEGVKVMPYSWRVSTPLSNFEANLNYKDTQDPSVTVKFALTSEPNNFILAWTTTPWTLPSNLALCAGPNLNYVCLQPHESEEKYWICEGRLSAYFEEGSYQIIKKCAGKELEGLAYEPIFRFADGRVDLSKARRVLLDEYVSDESGTGIVHQAPAFGEDDLRICQREGIPVFDPVDTEGNFCTYMDFIAGMNIKEADKTIIRELKEQGSLFRQDTIQHSYPFCWRTDTPLIYKAISTWFVNVEAIKDRMVSHNQTVHWVPTHIRDGRFGKWLENARDWAISRNRYWGTPLPIWRSEDGDILCFGNVADLEEAVGQKITDLHKHFLDDLLINKNGKTYRRIPEVLDCWFESGAMPYAQQHYPFENKELFEENFPANFICEGLDQTRGWFYTLVVHAAALFDAPAFRNCIVNGLILAEDGKKMSKRLKNYPDPVEMLDRYGADAIRLYMLNSVAVQGESLRFSEQGLVEVTRSVLLPLWNSLSFLSTYAEIDGWEPTEANLAVEKTNPLDRWIMSCLQGLIAEVHSAMDLYELNRASAPFVHFIDLLTNWYLRRSRRRFWKDGRGQDKMSAYATLFLVLRDLSKIIACFVPYVAEGIYESLRREGDPISVHLDYFPAVDDKSRDTELETRMDLVLAAVNMGRALRSKHQLKTRQPLQRLFLITRDPEAQRILNELDALLLDELNIKELVLTENEEDLVGLSAQANFRVLGKRLGKRMKEVANQIKTLDLENIRRLQDGGSVTLQHTDGEVTLTLEDVLIQRSQREGLLVESSGSVTIALDTQLNESLIKEGLAREFVNKVQHMRKEQDLAVMDRIVIRYKSSDIVGKAIDVYRDFVCTETLCEKLLLEDNPGSEWDINGEICTIELQRINPSP